MAKRRANPEVQRVLDEDQLEPMPEPEVVLPGLAPFGRSLATAGCAMLVIGLAFGNYPYLLCALLLLAVPFAARALAPPSVSVVRALTAHDLRSGEALDVVVEVAPRGEAAGVTFHDRVPDPFVLDSGTNFGAAWLDAPRTLEYRLRAPRRGTHVFPPLRVTTHDATFCMSARETTAGEADEVVAHPLAPPAPRVRAPTAWGRAHLPGGDRAVRGVQTNDFRELRPYQRGDPLRQVNWKATARESRDNDLHLIVNDYEVEGKKAIWLFIDASPYTVGGTNLESIFDEIATGALAVSGHYLDMGHRVGATIYGSGAARVLYPDVGELQERRLQAALAAVTPGEHGETLAQAIEASKGFLAREKPLLFVFTLAGRDAALPRALVSARALASTGRRAAPVITIAPRIPQDGSPAARLVELQERAQLKALEKRGVAVVRYDPGKVPLQALLARGVIR